MKKFGKNSQEKTRKTSFSKSNTGMCTQPGYEDLRCGLNYKCENCLNTQMSRPDYDEFIAGMNIPDGV